MCSKQMIVSVAVLALLAIAAMPVRSLPSDREQAIEMMEFTRDVAGSTGFGFKAGTARRGV